MMALEPHGTDVWVGAGPRYPWGGLYGGQIVAQGLRAATFTVDPAFRVHSLHAYFIRSGDHTEPIRFEVDRVRNGRSFCTRRVTARQSVGVILELTASYQVDEAGPGADGADAGRAAARRADRRQLERDLRAPGGAPATGARCRVAAGGRSRSATIRHCRPAPWPTCPTTSPPRRSCRSTPTGTVRPSRSNGQFFSASLDHAICFHRPVASTTGTCSVHLPRPDELTRRERRLRVHPGRHPRGDGRAGGAAARRR